MMEILCSRGGLLSAASACVLICLVQCAGAQSCGGDNQPACPADLNHDAPYCTEEGVHATRSITLPAPSWCWKVKPDCGTGPNTDCCPSSYGRVWDPPLPAFACDGKDWTDLRDALYCEVDSNHPATVKYDENAVWGYRAGKCVQNDADCGEAGKRCCKFVGAISDSSSVWYCRGADGQLSSNNDLCGSDEYCASQ